MPRNGSGSYSLPAGNPFVPNTVISSTTMNNTMNDLGTALTQSIANDGQTTPVANLPMATFRHTNVGNAVARNDYAAAGQVQDSSLQWLTSVAGTNTITASIAPGPTSYAAGQTFRFVAANTNTGATTININGLGSKNITKNGTTPVGADDIIAGAVYEIVYDGTQFQQVNVSEGAIYEVRGLDGLAGSPSGVQAVFASKGAVLWSPSTKTSYTSGPISSRTNDISVGGPIANGRDQAAAFPAATTVHFYYIWNGAAIQTISSLTAPDSGGPAMPTGYTHWAYIGAVTTTGGNLRVVVMRGSWFSFSPLISAISSSSLTTAETSVSTSGIIPTNAMNYTINLRGTITSGGGGAVNAVMFIRIASGTNYDDYTVITAAASTLGGLYGFSILPYFGASFIYAMSNITNISTASYTINLHSYQMPNGG